MSTLPPILRSFKATWSLFAAAPLHFLILQIPEVSVEAIYALFPGIREASMPLVLAILFPYLAIVSFLSTALTFVSTESGKSGRPITLRGTILVVMERLGTLLPVALLTGTILLLGMVALVLPFLYFMTLYLFVPFIVMTEARLKWSVYLHKSKVVAKRHFWSCLFLVVLMLVVSFGTDAASNELVNRVPAAGLVGIKLLASLFTSAILGIWNGLFFLEIREPRNENT